MNFYNFGSVTVHYLFKNDWQMGFILLKSKLGHSLLEKGKKLTIFKSIVINAPFSYMVVFFMKWYNFNRIREDGKQTQILYWTATPSFNVYQLFFY